LRAAFQLVDDLLGIWGDPVVTGKPAYADLAARKKSLPVVGALTSVTAAGKHLGRLYHREEPLDEQDLVHASSLIEPVGGRAWAQAEAGRCLHAVLGYLAQADLESGAAADLETLPALVTQRDYLI
jgi:geranylgeranyl diphosphate synthase type I